ncbi:MAG: response regulator [Nibricoccus sp.]
MKPRILLVEDDEFIGVLVRTVLTSSGFEVVIVDRFEAVRALEPFSFDAVVTDYQLPGANGCDVIEYARSVSPDIAALLVSGHGDSILDTVASRGLTNVHTLNKPFNVDALLAKIEGVLPFSRITKENCLL